MTTIEDKINLFSKVIYDKVNDEKEEKLKAFDAKALEKAGAFSIVLECVPKGVAKVLKETLSIPILGIGAGPYVDCQVLVTQDLLGMYGDLQPKFVKQFSNIRQAMIDGLNKFHEESISGEFPSKDYSFNAKVEGFEE